MPANALVRLPELRDQVGSARVSIQQMVALQLPDGDETAVTRAHRFFGGLGTGLITGTADQLRSYFAGLAAQGVERVYVWFADQAAISSSRGFRRSCHVGVHLYGAARRLRAAVDCRRRGQHLAGDVAWAVLAREEQRGVGAGLSGTPTRRTGRPSAMVARRCSSNT